jgi:hypothetical protein
MSTSDVIVGLDDSAATQAALGWAAQDARGVRPAVDCVHVSAFIADPPVGWSPENTPPERRSDLELGPMAERVRTMFSSIGLDPLGVCTLSAERPAVVSSTSRVAPSYLRWALESTRRRRSRP